MSHWRIRTIFKSLERVLFFPVDNSSILFVVSLDVLLMFVEGHYKIHERETGEAGPSWLVLRGHCQLQIRMFPVDNYFATWTCIIAICGIAILGLQLASEPVLRTFVGIGVAMTTTGYGIYMLYAGNQYLKANQSE